MDLAPNAVPGRVEGGRERKDPLVRGRGGGRIDASLERLILLRSWFTGTVEGYRGQSLSTGTGSKSIRMSDGGE